MSARRSRRDVLRLAAGCAGLCASGCGGAGPASDDPDGASPSADGGGVREVAVALADLPVGALVSTDTAGCGAPRGAFVGRDAAGVFAFSDRCTHAGGQVGGPDGAGVLRCCLHGAEYDRSGGVGRGVVPGQAALDALQVRVEGVGAASRVVVSLDRREADRSRRVAVPS